MSRSRAQPAAEAWPRPCRPRRRNAGGTCPQARRAPARPARSWWQSRPDTSWRRSAPRSHRPRAPTTPRHRRPRFADSCEKSSFGANWAGLTKIETTTRSARRRARRTSARWPACSAPMVGTSATVSPLAAGARNPGAQRRNRADHLRLRVSFRCGFWFLASWFKLIVNLSKTRAKLDRKRGQTHDLAP